MKREKFDLVSVKRDPYQPPLPPPIPPSFFNVLELSRRNEIRKYFAGGQQWQIELSSPKDEEEDFLEQTAWKCQDFIEIQINACLNLFFFLPSISYYLQLWSLDFPESLLSISCISKPSRLIPSNCSIFTWKSGIPITPNGASYILCESTILLFVAGILFYGGFP